MTSTLLWDLADLFQREARDADIEGDAWEADRLWECAGELGERAMQTEIEESLVETGTRACPTREGASLCAALSE